MSIQNITADEAVKEISGKTLFLDVRTPQEYSKQKIPRSMNIPVDEIHEKIDSVISDKSKRIIVYCLSGSRSKIAVSVMENKGYNNVLDLTNGLLEWRSKQYPLE